MAWRIDRHVVKGVIENRIPGVVTGQIWLKGLNKPMQLALRGNCYRDLAGSRLEFKNPRPIEGDYAGLDIHQDGAVGDMTASRKVKVPKSTEPLAAQQDDEQLGFLLCNCLYLEWFSDSNGRVLIETVDYQWNISLPRWNLSEGEEAVQRQRNQQAMLTFVEQLASAIDADDEVELGAGEMNEFQWEAYLQKSDARSDMLLELFEKYEDDPKCEEIIANAMGWEIDAVDYADDLDEEEWDDLVRSVEEDEGEAGDYSPSNPLIATMMDVTSRIFYETESRGLLNDDTSNPWNQLLWHSQMTVSKLIAALERAGHDVEFEPGFVIATLKRALHLLHLTIATLEAASSIEPSKKGDWRQGIRRDLFAIRESIIDLMQTYRRKRG